MEVGIEKAERFLFHKKILEVIPAENAEAFNAKTSSVWKQTPEEKATFLLFLCEMFFSLSLFGHR
jgi:hypothetical protein